MPSRENAEKKGNEAEKSQGDNTDRAEHHDERDDGADVADEEGEDTLPSELELAALFYLLDNGSGLPDPANEDAQSQGCHSGEAVLAQVVDGVQNVGILAHPAQHAHAAEGAVTQRNGDGDDQVGGQRQQGALLVAPAPVLAGDGGVGSGHTDHGADSGKEHGNEEHEAENGAAGHALKDGFHGDEQHTCAGRGGIAKCKSGGNGGQSGQQSDDHVTQRNQQGILGQVTVVRGIGAIHQVGTEADVQGEEHLGQGDAEHGEPAAGAHNILGAGLEQELDARLGAGQGAGADGHNDQQNDQRGDHPLAGLLDTAGHVLADAEIGEKQAQEGPDQGLHRVGDEHGEVFGAVHGPEGAGRIKDRDAEFHHVLDDPAEQQAVEAHNAYADDGVQDTDELPFPVQLCPGCDGALAHLAANRVLGQGHGNAQQQRHHDVDDQEVEAAAAAQLGGEAPNIAQADSAADTGQHHAEVGAEFRAFDIFFFHFLLISSSI